MLFRPVFFLFWPRNVVKRGVCYHNVCPPICLSVCYTRAVTPKQFNTSKYVSHRTIEECFFVVKFRSPEFVRSPRRVR